MRGYVQIERGSFDMGSHKADPESFDVERPAHRVTLTKGFYLKATLVTQGEWEAVMGNNPSHFTGNAKRPVEQVSWYDAVAYCNALSEREGLLPAYKLSGVSGKPGREGFKIEKVEWERENLGYRLPTEAEWEYACRAGTSAPRYGELEQIGWYDDNSGSKTHPVGEKQANAWGLSDMIGNVWEWIYDGWKQEHTTTPVVDPICIAGTYRVIRGGGWNDDAEDCRAACRYNDDAGGRYSSLGFRPCRLTK